MIRAVGEQLALVHQQQLEDKRVHVDPISFEVREPHVEVLARAFWVSILVWCSASVDDVHYVDEMVQIRVSLDEICMQHQVPDESVVDSSPAQANFYVFSPYGGHEFWRKFAMEIACTVVCFNKMAGHVYYY